MDEPLRPHKFLFDFCTYLTAYLRGKAAGAINPANSDALILLPLYIFRPPLVNTGRKARTANGHTLAMPLRVSWGSDQSVLALSVGQSVTIPYRAVGAGYDFVGESTFTAPERGVWEYVPSDSQDNALVFGQPVKIHSRIPAWLNAASTQGNEARWTVATSMLAPYVRRAVDKRICALVWELKQYNLDIAPALQTGDNSIIVDTMILGAEGSPSSAVLRLIDRMALPNACASADLLRQVCTRIRRDADFAVRAFLGDDRCGKQIRTIYFQHRPTNITALRLQVATAHPTLNACPKKLRRALALVNVELSDV